MPERRFTFDEVADLYDRVRPGYPSALIDDVVHLSGVPPRGRVLELGCGTGKATQPFALRGYSLLCLEPGSQLARIAREKFAANRDVAVVSSTFEAWPLEAESFDLVISAQAFHWLDPELRFRKAAAALRSGGALAVFGNVMVPEASPLRSELDAAYARHAPELVGPSAAGWYREAGPIPEDFAASGCFGPVTSREYAWSAVYTSADYLDLLRTSSDHRMLEEAQREALLDAVGRAVDAHGGEIRVPYTSSLHLARVARAAAAI